MFYFFTVWYNLSKREVSKLQQKMTVGDRLLSIREARKETQEEVEEAIGISHVSISRYETGQRIPKMDRLVKLARHYGVTTDYLLTGYDPEQKKEPAIPDGLDEHFLERISHLSPANVRRMDEYLDMLLAVQDKPEP